MNQIMECVPNISEGRDKEVINAIATTISSVENVSLLHVDTGIATNRTVYTFAGKPDAVCEAAFQMTRRACELIDMRRHKGTHPRQGAVDVLPLVPVSGITLEECAELVRQLAQRIADELGIPSYAYEAAAFKPERRNLAVCRAGEYEALSRKLYTPELRPDFMPVDFPEDGTVPETIQRSGISVIGARKYLIAVNFNLNTKDVRVAKEIAADVRESGRGPGHPGVLKSAKAIGWYIEEYGIAQVSMNLTDIDITPLHRAYEEVKRSAQRHGVRVTGTEIIGLIPQRVLTEAGPDMVKAMNLDDLRPFNPKEKVIEELIG